MFFASVLLMLGLMPVAGSVVYSQEKMQTGQFMQTEFFDHSQTYGRMEVPFRPLVPYQELPENRPEWSHEGSRCVLQNWHDLHMGVGINSLHTEQWGFPIPCASNSLCVQSPFRKCISDVHRWLQILSGVDRAPTPWKNLHHCQQIVLFVVMRDFTFNHMMQSHFDLWTFWQQFLTVYVECMQAIKINIITFSDKSGKATRHDQHPEANMACRCLKNWSGNVQHELFGVGSREFAAPPQHTGFFGRFMTQSLLELSQPSFSRLFFSDSGSLQLGSHCIHGCRSERIRVSGKRRSSCDFEMQSHNIVHIIGHFAFGETQWLLCGGFEGTEIEHSSCNVGFKFHNNAIKHRKNHIVQFNLNFDKIKHNGKHVDISCHSASEKIGCSHRVENHIFHLYDIIYHWGFDAWRILGTVVLWCIRVCCKTRKTRLVILKQCIFVKGKRVWSKNRSHAFHHPVLCCIQVDTCSHYDNNWGPFNEIQQSRTFRHCFVAQPAPQRTSSRRSQYIGQKTDRRWPVHSNPDARGHVRIHHKGHTQHCHKGIPLQIGRCKKGLFRIPKIFRRTAFQGIRVGEAKVPGPEQLDIGCFNPTQLFGKEDDVMAWGQGIYCGAETSMTTAALKVLRPRFRSRGFHTVFSEPVEPIQPKVSQIRGKASGVAIISSFPIRQFHEPVTSDIEDACRFVDGVVQLGPNCVAYVASIYGVASSSVALDPISITNHLFNFAAERALSFKGPAIIAGDFNCNLSDLGGWDTMVQNGWCDAAVLDGILHGREPQPTSKEAVRKSFILMNGPLSTALQECRTCEDHLFPVHPLLLAKCSFSNVINPNLQWVLPKSVDGFMFDPHLMEEAAQDFVCRHNTKFQHALDQSLDEAASLMAFAVEHSWKKACVDAEGNKTRISPGHFGRDKLQPLKMKACSVPVVRKARDSDFDPGLGQPSVEIRRHTRQLRRIESLFLQLKAYNRTPTQGALVKCKQLWCAILEATGFTGSFPLWICTHFQMFVPVNLPHIGYILELKDVYRAWHQAEVNKFFLYKIKARRKSILQDIRKGGSRCFEEIREPAPLPQSFVAYQIKLKVQYTPWPKQGRECVKVVSADKLDINVPVTFQGQVRNITKIQGCFVHFDTPIRLRNLNMILEQNQTTADPTQMHNRTFEAWNEDWKRDHNDPNDDDWEDVIPYLQHINPVPTIPYRKFDLELWNKHLTAVKIKTARGGCGFSAKEMSMFPPSILTWLFCIYERCEQGSAWPRTWVLARVSMLAKSPKPTTPFDARPITVFSILYRQWARVRSKQILQNMAIYMPRAVSMATCRVPADVAAAYIATLVEDAINNNQKLAGFGIDLKRCFNTLPRWPLTLAMQRMGIPAEYILGWNSMLNTMQRTLWLGSCQSDPQHSTTGAPEGCGFSVVAMAVMSWWQAMTMKERAKQVETFTYADNWNYAATTTRIILHALEELKLFVSCMRMQISPSKSWMWATDQKGRKDLKGVKVNHEPILVVTNFSDLGCDVQYSKVQKKPKQNKRWQKTIRLCKRIGYSKTPRKFKEHMTVSSGLSGATFGTPVTYVPKTKWRTLRANMAQTVRLATAGASAWIAMGCTFKDPQLKSLGYTLRFWKRFLTIFPEMKTKFINNMQGACVSRVGPIACLKKTLRDAGWVIIQPGCIKHTITGYQLDWFSASKKYLWFVLERQWCHTISQQVAHRKDWQPEVVDLHLFAQVVSKKSHRDYWMLRTAASGKHYTNDIISKYTNNVQPKCPFCNRRDSKKHRLWECSAFSDLRTQFHGTVRKVKGQRVNLGLYALPTMQKPIFSHLPDRDKVFRTMCCASDFTYNKILVLGWHSFWTRI